MKKFFLTALVFCSLFISACSQTSIEGSIKTAAEISQEGKYGGLDFIKNGKDGKSANYRDGMYSYWFDPEGRLTSRTLSRRGGEKKDISANEALAIATKELTQYTKEQDFSSDGWSINITRLSGAEDAWFIEYTFKDDKNVLTQRHSATIDKNAAVTLLFVSDEKGAEDAVIIDEEEAIKIAYDAAFEEEDLKKSALFISQKELFAQDGKTVWHIKAQKASKDNEKSRSYFVYIDAVTGEIISTDKCK